MQLEKRHSCETQLTTVINDWAKILDNGGQVDTFILDFEKALVTPPHELLKSKLSGCGLGGKTLKWIDSTFVTENYNFETGSMTGILEHLKWESLKKRRRDTRLISLYKDLKGKASIPTDDLSSFFLSFYTYCYTLSRWLWAGVHCTYRFAWWKPTSNHINYCRVL